MAKGEVKKSVILPIVLIWVFILTVITITLIVNVFQLTHYMTQICTIIDNEVLSMDEKLDKIMPIVEKYERAMKPPDTQSTQQFGVGDSRVKEVEEPDDKK